MSRRRALSSARLALVPWLAAVAVAAVAASVPAADAGAKVRGCRVGASEVRFDDGRLLLTRSERAVNPRTARERWWACWRPSGRRSLLADVRHGRGTDELALVAVRRARFVVLGGAGHLDVFDGRLGRTTATIDQVGVVRELVVTPQGRAAALQDVPGHQRQLWAGAGTRACLLDAGAAKHGADVFGDLAVRAERLEWHRDGVTFGSPLARLAC